MTDTTNYTYDEPYAGDFIGGAGRYFTPTSINIEPYPYAFTFTDAKSREVLKFWADGRVTSDPSIEPDETARLVIDSVIAMWPIALSKYNAENSDVRSHLKDVATIISPGSFADGEDLNNWGYPAQVRRDAYKKATEILDYLELKLC